MEVNMALHNIEYNLQSDNRTDIRIEVAKLFTLEEPGIGKGENCSKYHYIVFNCSQKTNRFEQGF